jgi:hypothetical protein
MKPKQAALEIQSQAGNAVRATAVEIKKQFLQRTPGKYKKSRRALFAEGQGAKAMVGLEFNKQYPSKGTETQKRFKKQWQEIKPQVQQILTHQLNEILKGN